MVDDSDDECTVEDDTGVSVLPDGRRESRSYADVVPHNGGRSRGYFIGTSLGTSIVADSVQEGNLQTASNHNEVADLSDAALQHDSNTRSLENNEHVDIEGQESQNHGTVNPVSPNVSESGQGSVEAGPSIDLNWQPVCSASAAEDVVRDSSLMPMSLDEEARVIEALEDFLDERDWDRVPNLEVSDLESDDGTLENNTEGNRR